MHGLPATDRHLESLVAAFDERGELVDREVVPHAVAEPCDDVAGVLGERECGLLALPAAVAVLRRLGQVPVVQRGERFDAGVEELVDQPVVEVESLRVRLAGPVGGRSAARRSRTGTRSR
ncbi:hypothetical protein GCM10009559_34700 [Pseudonocardia zijingensis]|uniref:Uncharacterized protein n=1 Tax=Pseudonocardia zijingensis TaxID=153376 RepID=A0ABN1QBD7_9PSEU